MGRGRGDAPGDPRVGTDILTIGQYLRPSPQHLPVERYYTPEEFEALRALALGLGFAHVESGPLVRSSYHAESRCRDRSGSGSGSESNTGDWRGITNTSHPTIRGPSSRYGFACAQLSLSRWGSAPRTPPGCLLPRLRPPELPRAARCCDQRAPPKGTPGCAG